MKYLTFGANGAARFEERSLLPVSAACVVANAVRERLGALARCELDLRLWPPAIPDRDAWNAILDGASVYVVAGSLTDAALVLRPRDAAVVAALLFGEATDADSRRPLSPFESEITRRAVSALVTTLSPVCGDARLDPSRDKIDAVTYFELHVCAPVECCIGVALAREPRATVTGRIRREAIAAATILATLEVPLPAMRAGDAGALRAGDVLGARATRATLRANGAWFAHGACGVQDGRYAMRFDRGE